MSRLLKAATVLLLAPPLGILFLYQTGKNVEVARNLMWDLSYIHMELTDKLTEQ
ncbi:hypothetical protein PMIT1313_00058 [Prochlorococcus marinus str. MIT 1313]|uniref:hypothetical protein n=1 Tax=Prochlorococcus TaxID=1218 RepID=UPI0007C11395|nr:hypothetical protein [Prochlorococcus marinus]KZR72702.1 hypothetical protein PMIT1313_00058 [Prochlorococcus marinus str. MIT 1313]